MHKIICLRANWRSLLFLFVIFINLLFTIGFTNPSSSPSPTPSICPTSDSNVTFDQQPTHSNFSLFVLSMQWPFSVCSTISSHAADICRSPPNSFTVRGLWPTSSEKGQSPTCCGQPFSMAAISDIAPALRRFWPDLSPKANDVSLWQKQWLLHGSCSGLLERNYFRKVLDLSRRYSFLRALNAQGVVASSEKDHDFHIVQHALDEAAGGYHVRMRCIKLAGRYYLDAVQVCLHRDRFSTVHCPIQCLDGQDDCCSSHQKIRIPYWRHEHSSRNKTDDLSSYSSNNASSEQIIVRDLLALAFILVIVSYCMYKFYDYSVDRSVYSRGPYRRIPS